MSTTELAVFISAIAALISAAAATFSAITARATIKYAKTTEEMAKNEKRKHQYTIFNDRFDDIKKEYSDISAVGFKEIIYTGPNALRILIQKDDLRRLQIRLNNEQGFNQFRYVIQNIPTLIADLNKLHEDDRESVRINLIKFYDNYIKEFIEILLTYKEHIMGLTPKQGQLLTECYNLYDKMAKL